MGAESLQLSPSLLDPKRMGAQGVAFCGQTDQAFLWEKTKDHAMSLLDLCWMFTENHVEFKNNTTMNNGIFMDVC